MENKETPEQKEGFEKKTLQTLYFAYKSCLPLILFSLLLGFLGRGLLLANANIIGFWVDSLCVEKCRPIPDFFVHYQPHDYLVLLISIATIGFVLTVIFRIIFSRLSALAISKIYDEVTLRTSRFPMSFFDHNPAGRIVTRFSSDYGNVFRLFGGPLAEFMAIIFDLLMMIVLIALASPIYLIFVGIIVVLNYLVYRFNRTKLRRLRRDLSASRSPGIAHFVETTQGASAIRTFRREKSFSQRFSQLDQFYLDKKLLTVKNTLAFSFQMNSLSAVFLLITGVSSYFLVQKQFLSIGSVGVAFTFIALSGNTVQMFFEWLTQLEDALIGVERLDTYLRSPIEDGNHLPSMAEFATDHPYHTVQQEDQVAKFKPQSVSASVNIENLWFRYSPDQPWILKNINLSVKAGEKLGIIGPTGSGKSSLIQALFYLYPLQKGSIAIDNKTPRLILKNETSDFMPQIDLQEYRKFISFIAQEPVLFQGSLRDNLDIEKTHSDDELLMVLEKVDLKKWVLSHALGLGLSVEERGKNLSLGERQLICLARCLLQKSSVVIMDEATSSVDPQSEEIMVLATDNFFKERTQIIIAHRLSTLEKCDRVVWLDQGEIKKIGPASEVISAFERTVSSWP
ncbi:MAG: ABC transporter ATP-binding protein [Pseudobdellovibrionaceae bacterium]